MTLIGVIRQHMVFVGVMVVMLLLFGIVLNWSAAALTRSNTNPVTTPMPVVTVTTNTTTPMPVVTVTTNTTTPMPVVTVTTNTTTNS